MPGPLCIFPHVYFPRPPYIPLYKKTQAPPYPQYFCLRGRRLFWIPVRFSFPGVFYPMSSPQRRADAESLPSREWAIHPYMNPPSIQKSICRYSQPACLHSCTACFHIPVCFILIVQIFTYMNFYTKIPCSADESFFTPERCRRFHPPRKRLSGLIPAQITAFLRARGTSSLANRLCQSIVWICPALPFNGPLTNRSRPLSRSR